MARTATPQCQVVETRYCFSRIADALGHLPRWRRRALADHCEVNTMGKTGDNNTIASARKTENEERSKLSVSLAEVGSTVVSDSEVVYSRTEGIVNVKLIFLDIDGPIAPWRKGKPVRWSVVDSMDKAPYAKNVAALRRIIEGAGGPKIVKVVISSNWRTEKDRFHWLAAALKQRGIDVIGHTDVIQMHPSVHGDRGVLRRNMEIFRALTARLLGESGPAVNSKGVNMFTPLSLPANWKITHWVAIDDLELDSVATQSVKNLSMFAFFLRAPEDIEAGNGWIELPHDYKARLSAFMREFRLSHFVHVDEERGIAGTRGAERLAIQHLTAASVNC